MAPHQVSPVAQRKDIRITLSGFPKEGPYYLSINEFPVSPGGNCSSAGRIYDPDEILGDQSSLPPPTCNPNAPRNCSVGDLSGKWKAMQVTNQVQPSTLPFMLNYSDPTLMFEGNDSIVNRSMVI
ncbi:MAG: hypothetical protein DHS80DRAFT_24831 [Piptocephalis tieghemiana]|nr:MAG: hypothetical protein DHS80DRAFT_24831 [Piptocephalis tieghemiana]